MCVCVYVRQAERERESLEQEAILASDKVTYEHSSSAFGRKHLLSVACNLTLIDQLVMSHPSTATSPTPNRTHGDELSRGGHIYGTRIAVATKTGRQGICSGELGSKS